MAKAMPTGNWQILLILEDSLEMEVPILHLKIEESLQSKVE
jgi:hypothetical protein